MAAAWRLLVERPAVARSREEERLTAAERDGSAWRVEAALVREDAWRLGTAEARLEAVAVLRPETLAGRVAVGRAAVLRVALCVREALPEELPDWAEARASARAEASLGSKDMVRQRPRKPAIKERMTTPIPISDVTAYYVRADEASLNTPGSAFP